MAEGFVHGSKVRRLERTPEGRVLLELEGSPPGEHDRVLALPAFPVRAPDAYVTLLLPGEDGRPGTELATIEDAGALPPAAREELERLIRRSRLTPVVEAVLELSDEGHGLRWSVRTERGEARFLTGRPGEAVQVLDDGRLLVRDVNDGRWHVPDPAALDERSRALLERLL